MKIVPVKLTDEQVKAVEAAFPDPSDPNQPKMKFSEKLRSLVAGGLALYQIAWPETPAHGGKRDGAGRKKETQAVEPKYHSVASGWSDVIHAARANSDEPMCGATLRNWRHGWLPRDGSVTCERCLRKMERESGKAIE